MKKRLPIGISDFRDVITANGYYVDKTLLIADWLQTIRGNVTLITRPRRFGKTLNMTMLREFFDITRDSKALFADLAIASTDHLAQMNQWPVIFLSFKDCKNDQAQTMRCILRQLQEAYLAFYLQQPVLDRYTKEKLERLLALLTQEQWQDMSAVSDSIYFLSKLLCQHYGRRVIILIDEYDTPMISAYEQGYYAEVRALFTSLYGTALKDNPYLERAMLTGIHRLAKENIFSGLNNLEVCTVLDHDYCPYFGLTSAETEALLAYYGLPLDDDVQKMYDGYHFGHQEMYNPWSILNYAKKQQLLPYWTNTASNALLVEAMLTADKRTQKSFEQLLAQGQTNVAVDLQTSFFELNQAATLWGLFLGSGYLTTNEVPTLDALQVNVWIPNQEVRASFRQIIERYGGFADNSLDDLFGALLRRDIADFQMVYEQILLTCTSFHDHAAENAYHMLFLGMCVYLNGEYLVSSNIESGHGRADISLTAKNPHRPSFIIEFKQGKDLERLAQAALAQIHEQKYYAGLTGETLLLGIAHDLSLIHILRNSPMV